MNEKLRSCHGIYETDDDDDTIDQIMQQLRYIFDGQTAKEVLEAYLA